MNRTKLKCYRYISGAVWLGWLFLAQLSYGQSHMGDRVELDTFYLGTHVADTICVGEKVHLSCDPAYKDEDILSYEWKIDGSAGVFSTKREVEVSPKTTTKYILSVRYLSRHPELVKNGDFQQGKTGFVSDYTYISDWYTLWNEGTYVVGNNPHSYHSHFIPITDHTKKNWDQGLMLICNGDKDPARNRTVWRQEISVVKDEIYAFSAWVNWVNDDDASASPMLYFRIGNEEVPCYGTNGTISRLDQGKWLQFYTTYKAPKTGKILIYLKNKSFAQGGNDFAVDDISFTPVAVVQDTIIVKVSPQVEIGPLSAPAFCEGTDVKLNPDVYGSGTLTYDWSKREGTVYRQKSDSPVLSLPAVQPEDAGHYRYIVQGVCKPDTVEFDLTVWEKLRFGGKANDTVRACVGEQVVLRADGFTGSSVGYDWGNRGRGFLPVTSDSVYYYKKSVEMSDAGRYLCYVWDKKGCSGDQYITRILEVEGKPALRRVEVSDNLVCKGTTVDLRAFTDDAGAWIEWVNTATGERTRKKPGETWRLVVEEPVSYRVMARNRCDSSEQQLVTIGVRPVVTSLDAGEDRIVCSGEKVVLSGTVNAGAGDGLTWRWSGPRTSGGQELVLSEVREEEEGEYTVTVKDACGHELTDTVRISLIRDMEGLSLSGDRLVCEGETARFSVEGGSYGLAYEWSAPSGRRETGKSLTVAPVQISDAGLYICTVEGRCGEKRTFSVRLDIRPAVELIPLTDKMTVCPGETVTFQVDMKGEGGTYEWFRNGSALGVENRALVLQQVTDADAGTYECVATNGCAGGETSVTCHLEVLEATRIIGRSPTQYVQPHDPVDLFVNALGKDNEYVWTIGDREVGRGAALHIEDIGESGSLLYICTVTGKCGKSWIAISVNIDDYIHLKEDAVADLCVGSRYAYAAELLPSGCAHETGVTYSWKFKGKEVSDEKAITFSGFSETDAGRYTCEITGSCGTARLNLDVNVLRKPQLVSLEADKPVYCEGDNLRLQAEGNAAGGMVFSWRKEEKTIGGEGTLLFREAVTPEDAGTYVCRVVNACGSDEKEVTVAVRPALRVEPGEPVLELCEGDPVSLKAEASGEALTYVWTGPSVRNWTGADQAVYSNSGLTAGETGRYRCDIGSACGSATVYRTLRIEEGLMVQAIPDRQVCSHTDQKLELRTNLTEGVSWKWFLPDGSEWEQRTLYIWDIRQTDTFRYEVKSRCRLQQGRVILIVYPEMETLSVNSDTAVCEGGTVVLEAFAEGKGVTYRWMGPSAFVTDRARTEITEVDRKKTGRYEVVATDICNRSLTGEVTVTLRNEFGGMEITGDTIVCPGADLGLEMTGGSPGLSYEWRRNGKTEGRESRLALTGIQEPDAGVYICRTTGICGVREDTVNVGVYRPLSARPGDPPAPVCPGGDVLLAVEAEGEALQYVWTRENGDYVGTMDSRLLLKDVQLRDSGIYSCRVTSRCGEARFDFGVKVLLPTTVLGAPSYKHASKDAPEKIAVRAEGENLTYEWYRDGVKLDCDSSVFVQEALNEVDTLYFMCIVTGTCGIDTVYTVLDVGNYRLATSSPDTMCAGSSYAYLVEVVPVNSTCWGDEPTTYTWYRKNEATNDTIREAGQILRFQDVKPEDAGTYYCHVYRDCGDTTFMLTLVVLDVPEIRSISAVDSIVIEGTEYTIEVDAAGSSLEYIWAKDGNVLAEADLPSLTFRPAKVEDSGKYTVTVGNRCGNFSRNSVLKVYEKTVVVSPKYRQIEICRGEDTTFYVEAKGEGLIYRWFCGDVLLAASSGNFYHPEDLTVSADYRCEVAGRADADTAYVSLVVHALPEVSFTGALEICRDELSYRQIYSSTAQQGVAYAWVFSGAEVLERPDRKEAEVRWKGLGEGGTVKLIQTDLLTRCRDSLEKQVKYLDLPEVNLDIAPVVGYCIDSLSLNRAWPSGGTYTVNGIPAGVLMLPDKESVYEVVYTYTDKTTGCTASASASTRSAEQPVVRLDKTVKMAGRCAELPLQVIKATSGTIVWESNVDLDVSDPLRALYRPAAEDGETLYFGVSLEDTYGCRDEDYMYVTSVPLPRLTLPADTVIGKCDGEEERWLEVGIGCRTDWLEELVWSPDTNVTLPAYTKGILYFKEAGEYPFQVKVKDIFGCEDTDAFTVTVIDGPVLKGREVCYGETIPVDCGEYAYTWSDGFAESRRELRDTGTLTLRLEDRQGCRAEAAFTVHPLPEPGLPDSLWLNEGEIVVLQPVLAEKYAPYRFLWQDGSALPVYKIHRAGSYRLRVADRLGCSAEAVVVVTDRTVIVSEKKENRILCAGEEVSFEVEVKGKTEAYRWYENGTLVEENLSPVWNFGALAKDAEYMCIVVAPHNTDTSRLQVRVKPLPEVVLPRDTVLGLCEEVLPYRIEGRYIAEEPDTLFWSPEGQVSANEEGRGDVIFQVPGEYMYTLTVRTVWGCQGADTMRITVAAPPELRGEEVCIGKTIYVGSGDFDFTWSDGYRGTERQIAEVGEYVLRITDKFGCTAEALYAVHPLPEFELPDTLYLYPGQHHVFEIRPEEDFGPYGIRWSDGTQGPVCDVSEEGIYRVEVSDRIGCISAKSVSVVQPVHYYAPNAFLPKSSGENSRFYLKDVNFSEPFEMYIYNRWGELVHKTRVIGFEGGWNGTFQGEDCLPGAYVWVAYSGGKVLGKGTLVLIR